jgi:hypothetical protein
VQNLELSKDARELAALKRQMRRKKTATPAMPVLHPAKVIRKKKKILKLTQSLLTIHLVHPQIHRSSRGCAYGLSGPTGCLQFAP